MAIGMSKTLVFASVAFFRAAAFDVEIISDLTTTGTDEKRALDIKNQQFWQPLLDNAESTKMAAAYTHLSVYDEVDAALRELPGENVHVKELLSDALLRLKRADQTVFKEAVESAEVASQQLLEGPSDEDTFSFLTGGQNYFAQAIRRFVGFGKYGERLSKQIRKRQADVTPMLRGAAAATSNVLDDCREGSKLGFDVLKYDIYTKGAPKTPERVKKAAYKLIDAVSETRHNFMQGITNVANGIAQDSTHKDVAAAATVTQSLAHALDLPVTANSKVLIDI